MTDAQLLENFVIRRDEAAFEVLVWRHGTMVLSLCQRVLHDTHEAEDAFQAAFLVFARKAGSIGKQRSGRQLALQGGIPGRPPDPQQAAKQSAPTALSPEERGIDDVPAPEAADEVLWRDLRPVLDEEIDRLPEKYRAPFVLCHLQGHTNEEAAELLGCPKGTILSRLSRGREQLRHRLTRRGLALSAGGLVLALSQNAAAAAVPAALVGSTVEAAILFAAGKAAAGLVSASVAALIEGVLHTMYLSKLKFVTAALLALAMLGTGVGVVSYHTLAGQPDQARRPVSPRTEGNKPELEPQQNVAYEEEEGRGEREGRRKTDVQGKVAEFDGKTMTLEVGGGRGEEPKKVAIKLTDKTKIEWTGPLNDPANKIKVGDTAVVTLQEGSADTAAIVQAQRKVDVTGKIAEVSADGKTLTIAIPAPTAVRRRRAASCSPRRRRSSSSAR